ncbi:MAG: hypothetical protein GXO85_06790 [Chlorobi bacterium]|nr:hypothetical protein [Chlorobiota bacterium]
MPQSINKYKILVASPSDVLDERESMDEVFSELDKTYGSRNNLVLELIKWETNTAPAISETDIQDLIDKDVGSDYDLFIGILWKKFGTPTKKFGSGTEQEFQNAYTRFKKKPKALQILFYFKTSTPLSLSDIEPSELEKVNKFKKELGKKNVYYWEYNNTEELQKFLRIHIPQRIDELRKTNIISESNKKETKQAIIEEELYEEELGIIDYQELIEESFGDSTQALLRISESTEWIGNEINKKTDEIQSLTAKKLDISKKVARDFFRRTAEVMNDFAKRIEPDIPIFMNSFEKGIDALSNLVTLYCSDIDNTQDAVIQEITDLIIGLLSSIKVAEEGIESFLESIKTLPRMEKQLNKARRNVAIKIEEFLNKLKISYSIANELYKNLHK